MKPFLSLISWYTKKLVLVWNRNSHNAFFTYSPGLFYTSFILNCPRLLSKWMISWDQLLKLIQMTSLCILTKNTLSRAYRSRLITPQFPQCDRQNFNENASRIWYYFSPGESLACCDVYSWLSTWLHLEWTKAPKWRAHLFDDLPQFELGRSTYNTDFWGRKTCF